jgi:hypothetical protein
MLEYFSYKKFKKSKAEKEEKASKGKEVETTPTVETPKVQAPKVDTPKDTFVVAEGASSSAQDEIPTPLLTDDDERFLERLTTPSTTVEYEDDDGPAPPLPPRVATPELSWDSDSESFIKPSSKTKTLEKKDEEGESSKAAGKKLNRFSTLFSRNNNNNKKKDQQLVPVQPEPSNNLTVPLPEDEEAREKDDLTRVLDDLNLSARNNTAFSMSAESTELVRRFTLILKDLVNGVPTAVNDLTSLLDDPDGKLAKNYEKLPKSLKKLVTQLPEKLSSTLAPELLAVAAEAQGLASSSSADKGGLKGAAKRLLVPKNLADMVTKPGAIVGMLKGIMNALKMRWPAFIGTNVIWSVALSRKFCPPFPDPSLSRSD